MYNLPKHLGRHPQGSHKQRARRQAPQRQVIEAAREAGQEAAQAGSAAIKLPISRAWRA